MLNPRLHQIEAINANIKAFKTANRTKNIMACGSGKTLVAIKTISQLTQLPTYNNVVVFMPTLLLMKQIIEDVIGEFGREHYCYAAVCSKQKIEIDDIGVDEIFDLNIPVLVGPLSISKFIKSSGKKIIFCTYASAKHLKGLNFDLGVFDEAHKTAGEINKPYSYPLYDENISIKKRLFLTATERVELNKRENRTGMNNMEFYGETSYSLPFKKAIDLGLIADYKLIITVVYKSDIAHLIHDDEKNIYDVANLFALEKCKEKYGINKIITFHKTIARAESFKEAGNNSSFDAYHINGNQNNLTRCDVFNSFRKSKSAYITNARCLTEGVDTPDVDAVAFFDPKSGEIDVVQAIGRAIRLSEGKTTGFIILPLYIWDLEEALSKESIGKDSAFKNIVDIVSVLKNEDTDFKTKLNKTGFKLSNNDVLDDLPIEINGDLPLSITKDYLFRNIAVEVVSNYDAHFLAMLEKLDQYIEKNGHGYVYLNSEDRELALWANAQRANKRYKTLAKYREDLLSEHKFVFSIFDYEWEQNFIKYKNLIMQGYTNETIEDKAIKKWLSRQGVACKKNRLTEDKIERLKLLGYEYISKDDIWRKGYDLLLKELGDKKSLSNFSKKDESYEWLRTQRRRWEKLDENKRKLLLDLGWNEYIKQLGQRSKKALI